MVAKYMHSSSQVQQHGTGCRAPFATLCPWTVSRWLYSSLLKFNSIILSSCCCMHCMNDCVWCPSFGCRVMVPYKSSWHYYYFLPTSTKPRAWKLSRMLHNGCNDFLFGVHCVEEGDRISPAAALWTGVETERLFLWCLGWWLWCVCQSPGLAQ